MRGLAALLVLGGCESAIVVSVEVEVDGDVASAFSSDAPGVLATNAGGPWVIAPLCDPPLDVTRARHLAGFGCVREEQVGVDVPVTVWVQPMPEAWNASAFCALPTDGSPWLPQEVTRGGEDLLAAMPDAAWAQGADAGAWRLGSACGGTLRGARVNVAWP